jgi:hypothetical protein
MTSIDFIIAISAVLFINSFFIFQIFLKIDKMRIFIFKNVRKNIDTEMFFLTVLFISVIVMNKNVLMGSTLFNTPMVFIFVTLVYSVLFFIFIVFEKIYKKLNNV